MMTVHLICNAHLDPVWLWDWEEGIAGAFSTFRSAVELAEEFDYIFCHNEALLYEWVEICDPPLFASIRRLVKAGKWRIMGGWYLQPDCNMPSGESLIRQMMAGRRYFLEKFGQKPTTAVNVDPFGHSVGLVQILKKGGYDAYLICRPSASELPLADDFLWRGPDGSEIKVCRAAEHYNSPLGGAAEKIRKVLRQKAHKDVSLVLWGVGNHGGGPSRRDLTEIRSLMANSPEKILHSTPEQYMAESRAMCRWTHSLRPCMPGCYTSMVRVKQQHRRLENQLFFTEKLCAAAAVQDALEYPLTELEEAEKDLMFAQFHDILPGTAVPCGEETGLRRLHHGLETVSRLRARAFFALCLGEEKAKAGEYPIMVFNPHPYPMKTVVDVGLILENQNWEESFTELAVYHGEALLPTQTVKEMSNVNLDWAKRILFYGELAPLSVTRFDARPVGVSSRLRQRQTDGDFVFENEGLYVRIGGKSGLIEGLRIDGELLIDAPAPFVLYRDNADPWAMSARQRKCLAEPDSMLRLMSPQECASFAGTDRPFPPVRVIEDGAVIREVEALFSLRDTVLCVRYAIHRLQPFIDVRITAFFRAADALLKWHIPAAFEAGLAAQTAYATEGLLQDGSEHVMQKWVCQSNERCAFAVLNTGSYGFSCLKNELQLTLVRSAAYAAHPIEARPLLRDDRVIPRMDQGKREFFFRLTGGEVKRMLPALDRLALECNEEPYALQVFPNGQGAVFRECPLRLDGDASITLGAFKASRGGGYILRLYNGSDKAAATRLTACFCDCSAEIPLGPYEFKTFRIQNGLMVECAEAET